MKSNNNESKMMKAPERGVPLAAAAGGGRNKKMIHKKKENVRDNNNHACNVHVKRRKQQQQQQQQQHYHVVEMEQEEGEGQDYGKESAKLVLNTTSSSVKQQPAQQQPQHQQPQEAFRWGFPDALLPSSTSSSSTASVDIATQLSRVFHLIAATEDCHAMQSFCARTLDAILLSSTVVAFAEAATTTTASCAAIRQLQQQRPLLTPTLLAMERYRTSVAVQLDGCKVLQHVWSNQTVIQQPQPQDEEHSSAEHQQAAAAAAQVVAARVLQCQDAVRTVYTVLHTCLQGHGTTNAVVCSVSLDVLRRLKPFVSSPRDFNLGIPTLLQCVQHYVRIAATSASTTSTTAATTGCTAPTPEAAATSATTTNLKPTLVITTTTRRKNKRSNSNSDNHRRKRRKTNNNDNDNTAKATTPETSAAKSKLSSTAVLTLHNNQDKESSTTMTTSNSSSNSSNHALIVIQIALSITAWLAEDSASRTVLIGQGGIPILSQTIISVTHDALTQCNAAATLCWLVHSNNNNTTTTNATPAGATANNAAALPMNGAARNNNNNPIRNNRTVLLQGGARGARELPNQQQQQQPMVVANNARTTVATATDSSAATTTTPSGMNARVLVPCILQSMQRHMDNASVFGNMVCLLSGLDNHHLVFFDASNGNDTESVPVAVQELKVLQLVRKGMERHLTSPKVQESCLRWIRFHDGSNDILPQQQNAAADTNNTQQQQHSILLRMELLQCIPIIQRSMTFHLDDPHLQAQACDVLASMADHDFDVLRKAVLGSGAIDCVLQALQRHPQHRRVQQGSMWFLTLAMPLIGMTRMHRNPNNNRNDNNAAAAAARMDIPPGEISAAAAFGGGFPALGTMFQLLLVQHAQRQQLQQQPSGSRVTASGSVPLILPGIPNQVVG